MLDTISLNIDYSKQGLTLNNVTSLFSTNVYEHYKKGGDNYWITGSNKDWGLKANNKVLIITGSIAKNINKSNFYTPTYSQIIDYFNNASNTLNIDLFKANIKRIDIANNILMEEPPKVYYKFLGEQKGWTKNGYDGTEQWKNKSRETKLMYDKSKWAKDTSNFIPGEFENKNVLRWEYRCLNNNSLTKIIGNNTELNCLLNEPNYMLLFKASIKQYNNIPKINNIDFMIDNVKTPKEAIDGLLVTLVQNSDERIVKNYFDTLDNKGVFKNRTQKYRYKNMIHDKLSKHRSKNDYIDELDSKINNIKAL
tara:strand:+ start:134 stop:1060 length:927 start_codon:yes stop_codon:yes gene_type:complete